MATHQTVRLSRGSHRAPERGVCVMELASMLAGEPFTDKPKSVSGVIGGFLRTFNDGLDDRRRQSLYEYAARVVGTHAAHEVERERGALCVRWARARGARVPLSVRLWPHTAAAGQLAAGCLMPIAADAEHAAGLLLLDDLIALGDSWAGVPAKPSELLAMSAHHDILQ